MKKTLTIIATFFAFLGIVFTILPFDTLALLPLGLAVLFGSLAMINANGKQQKITKIVLIVSVLGALVVIGKEVFVKNEVNVDTKFDQQKIESKKEAEKDLEGLE
jgi:hypothetical protein